MDNAARQVAAILLAIPGAVSVGIWQSNPWAGLAAHAVLYILFSIDSRLREANDHLARARSSGIVEL